MNAAKRKLVGRRLLIVAANLATVAIIVKVATISPIRAAVLVVACLLVVVILERRDIAGFIHRRARH